jgi:mRNA interferase RelE/StbE
MSFKVHIDEKVFKFLQKFAKTNRKMYGRIDTFLNETLPNAESPCTLPNAKKLVGFDDNRYRWRLGDYRVIGIVIKQEFHIIQVIKIDIKGEDIYK